MVFIFGDLSHIIKTHEIDDKLAKVVVPNKLASLKKLIIQN